MVVGRLLLYGDGLFSGAMLNFQFSTNISDNPNSRQNGQPETSVECLASMGPDPVRVIAPMETISKGWNNHLAGTPLFSPQICSPQKPEWQEGLVTLMSCLDRKPCMIRSGLRAVHQMEVKVLNLQPVCSFAPQKSRENGHPGCSFTQKSREKKYQLLLLLNKNSSLRLAESQWKSSFQVGKFHKKKPFQQKWGRGGPIFPTLLPYRSHENPLNVPTAWGGRVPWEKFRESHTAWLIWTLRGPSEIIPRYPTNMIFTLRNPYIPLNFVLNIQLFSTYGSPTYKIFRILNSWGGPTVACIPRAPANVSQSDLSFKMGGPWKRWSFQVRIRESTMVFTFYSGVFIGYILVKIMRCIRKKMSLLGTNTYPFPRFWDSFRRWFSSFYLWVGYGFPRSLEGKSHLFPWFRREKTIQTTPAMNPKPEKKTARKKWGPENKNPKSCVVWLPNRQEPSVEGSNHLKSHLK